MTWLPDLPSDMGPALIIGACLILVAISLGSYSLVAPAPKKLHISRRRPPGETPPSVLTRGAEATTDLIAAFLNRRDVGAERSLLEEAGIKTRLQDLIVMVASATLVAGVVGWFVGGLLVAVLLMLLIPIGTRIGLGIKRSRRRTKFADQLDDSLQLMASSLRAGHSLLHAMDSVAREADQPTSEEFSRIINELRMGRDLQETLRHTSVRLASQDFDWVTQAVIINRDVGGNLAEVLEGVAHTIRERAEIRRQVKALAAEGKLSGIILVVMPFAIGGLVALLNPSYLARFVESVFGYILLGIAVILLVIGIAWIRKVVRIRF